jgi:hypothetical protein
MAGRANSQKGISMKGKLIMIALMFVIINLVFYFGFDSSDEVGENKELDTDIKLNDEIQSDLQYDLLQRINENLDVS